MTLFGQQEQLGWINSPVYYFIIPPMILESAITSEISHFVLVNSPLHCWYLFNYTFFISRGDIYTSSYFAMRSNFQNDPQNKTLWYPHNSVAVLGAYCSEITLKNEFSKDQTYQKFILHLGCYGLHQWLTVSPWMYFFVKCHKIQRCIAKMSCESEKNTNIIR